MNKVITQFNYYTISVNTLFTVIKYNFFHHSLVATKFEHTRPH